MAHTTANVWLNLCSPVHSRGISADRRRSVRVPFSGHHAIVCRSESQKLCSTKTDSGTQEAVLRVATPFLAAAFGLLTALSPMDAQAVSGGGGDLQGAAFADLSGKDFSGKKYYKSDFKGTNFSNCNLERTNMFGSFAKGASFRGANMRLADLESVDFEGADLTDAILEGAQVSGAQFKNVKIENTDWTDVVLRKDVQKALCAKAAGTNPVTGVDTRESLLCP